MRYSLVCFQVAAGNKENIPPVDDHVNSKTRQSHTENIGPISPEPPSQGRNGMVTRAANAKKHPGLLALDDEDLKALQKKNEAASRRQAQAEQKKADQARLLANTNRIAAFEDALSAQHEAMLVSAARPATRSGQTKALRPVVPMEPVSDASPQVDHVPGAPNRELVESDASGADDIDYVPTSESESEVATVSGNLMYSPIPTVTTIPTYPGCQY